MNFLKKDVFVRAFWMEKGTSKQKQKKSRQSESFVGHVNHYQDSK